MKTILKHNRIIRLCLAAVIFISVLTASVLVTKAWKDFYGFTFGGRYWLSPVVAAALYALGYFAAALIKKVHEACSRR